MSSNNAHRLHKKTHKKRLGDELVEKGVITPDQVKIAITEQKRSRKPLGQVLVDLGFVAESVMRDMLGEVLGNASVDLSQALPDPDALKLIPKELAQRLNVVPVSFDKTHKKLQIAMADTFNLVVLDRLRAHISRREVDIIPLLAGESEIKNTINQFYGFDISIDGILDEIETGEIDYASLNAAEDEYSHPFVRIVNAILADAVKQRASDIHFEPEKTFLRLRYRIDGVLHQIRSLHKNYWSAIVVRLKVLSGMNIAETRSPQDGRISLKIYGRQVDFRASVQPTHHGENFVLRVLDRDKGILPLEKLNINEHVLYTIKLMMARPEGIILVTGPTGSGKTTTLYSMLNHIKSIQMNIMTLEDPIEYPMEMIRQTDINEAGKIDFASGIRSLMRQDPDVILVGEIRDEDTAEMAFRAAMTGHQVYSTLHTNSALGAIPRLKDIGIKPDVLAGNIIGIIGQRLVRTLCPHCKKQRKAHDIELKLLSKHDDTSITCINESVGCSQCAHTGFKGRASVIEALRIDESLDHLIAHGASFIELKKHIKTLGYKTMVDDAIRLVKEGYSTLEEISRVIDLTEHL